MLKLLLLSSVGGGTAGEFLHRPAEGPAQRAAAHPAWHGQPGPDRQSRHTPAGDITGQVMRLSRLSLFYCLFLVSLGT